MPTQPEIASQMVSALGVTIPDLDTSIGTPTRKIIDAVAEVVAEAYVDQFFLGYNYDITSLTGSALDDFVNLFGMTRLAARRATGVCTFASPAAATQATAVPAGTAVATNDSPPVVFVTLITGVMPIGAISIDVPIIAQVGGSAGNVPPNAIAGFSTPLSGFSTVANTAATSGGADAESDEALRTRFTNTVFRNMAGTEQMFLGVAQENPQTVLANVIGSAKTHLEQIQITGGVGQSTIQNAKYIYPMNYAFGPSIANQQLLNPGIHYTFNPNTFVLAAPAAAPTLTAQTTGGTIPASRARFYRFAWGTAAGTTPASAEATVTVSAGSTNSVRLTFPAAPLQAQWIYVYGSNTTNTETLLAILPASTTTWTDTTGAAGTTAYPTANTSGYSPTINSIDAINCPDGIYDLQFQYVPMASRNDPVNGVTNKIDIYIQGTDAQSATDTVIWANPTTFNSNANDPMCYINFIHPDLTRPTPGNYFLPLTFQPVIGLPATITISALGGKPVAGSTSTVGSVIYAADAGTGTDVGAITYYYGVDYFLVNNQTSQGGSPHSNSGIEWRSVANGGNPLPPANSQLPVIYTYNAVPREVETAIQRWRLVTTDVWCHQSKQMFINTTFVVVLASGYTADGVLAGVQSALQNVFSLVGFDGILSTSELLTAVGQVQGILAVRFATQADATAAGTTSWAIQQINQAAGLIQTFSYNGRATDVYFPDDTVPVFNNAILYVRAFNTYANNS